MELLQSKRLSAINGLNHGFFFPGNERNIQDNLSFKSAPPDVVTEARKNACGLIDVPYTHLTHVYQEHGTKIWSVGKEQRGAGSTTGEDQVGNGDGLITDEANVPLAILIADCIPVFFSSNDARAVGLAHAGWRGTYDGISEKMVQKMYEDYSVDPNDLYAWIGPGISIDGFTVGDDVWPLFQEKWSDFKECFNREKRSIDLKKINQIQLEAAGVPTDNIDVSMECTFSDLRFFSYRRDGKGSGHNMAVIIKEEQ